MNTVTQVLLLISYAIFGIAAAMFLPMLGITPSTAQLIGALVFVSIWQIQLSFFGKGNDDIDMIDMHRVDEIEQLTLKLRKEVTALKESVDEQSEKGDAKDKKLVNELKTLQEFLIQVMQKESGKKGGRKPAGKTLADKASDGQADKVTAGGIEKPGLAADGAALVAAEEEQDQEVASELDIAEGDVENFDSDEDLDELDSADGPDLPDEPGKPDDSSLEGLPSPQPNTVNTPTIAAASKPSARAIGTPAAKAPDPSRMKTHAQRRAEAAKKRAPIRLIKREDQLLSVIKSSLSENRVDLYLQPMVSLPSRKAAHFECFSRVRDEEGRVVLPRQYMKVAETKGLIGTIDNLLMFRLIQLVRRLGRRRPDVRFFLNMSRYSIADEEFLPQFIDFMVSNPEFAERIVFEISQEDYLTLEDETVERLHTLGRKGFAFSMDLFTDFDQDFAELEKRNFKYIKADMTDILETNPEPGDIEEQKAYLRRRGMQLIASKIETEDMVIEALDNQIELAQGYLFGEPLAAEEIDTDL